MLQVRGSSMTDSCLSAGGDSGSTVSHENVEGSEPDFHRPSVTLQGVNDLKDQNSEELRSAMR